MTDTMAASIANIFSDDISKVELDVMRRMGEDLSCHGAMEAVLSLDGDEYLETLVCAVDLELHRPGSGFKYMMRVALPLLEPPTSRIQ